MSLVLDPRQRAMLKEMGVHVWQAQTAPAPAPAAAPLEVAVLPSPATAKATATVPEQAAAQPPVVLAAAPRTAAPVAAALDAVPSLDWSALVQTVASCQACKLCIGRRAPVFGAASSDATGSADQAHGVAPRADWLVVTEPPDEDEERAARPLVGAPGQLFDNMIKAIGVQRCGVNSANPADPANSANAAYLTHVVKCRPAQVRVPDAQELATCAQYLAREVALVQPKVIFALGRLAALSLLRAQHPELASTPLGKLRGTVYQFEGVPVIVSYHPATLLRTPLAKAAAWADLCLARSVLPVA